MLFQTLDEITEALLNTKSFISLSLSGLFSLISLCFLPLKLLKSLVQPRKHHTKNKSTDDGAAKHGCDNAIAFAVAILLEAPDVTSSNVTQLSKRVDEGDGHGSLGRGTRERRADPRIEDNVSKI